MGIPEDQAISLLEPYLNVPPAAMRQFLKDKLLSILDAGSRLSAIQPTGVPVSSGAGTAVVATGEFGAAQKGTALPGTTTRTELPPTQPLIAVEGEGVSMDTTSTVDAHGDGSGKGLRGNFLFPLASKSVSSVFSLPSVVSFPFFLFKNGFF
jgi:hypothetical protein